MTLSLPLLFFGAALAAEADPPCAGAAGPLSAPLDPTVDIEEAKAELFNAGVSLERRGCTDEADELYGLFVRRWPADERSEALAFRLAMRAASGPELGPAIVLLDDYATSYPTSEHTAAAVYTAAELRLGLEDWQGAASGFAHYAIRWRAAPDAPTVMARACEIEAKVEGASALSCWDQFLAAFGEHSSVLALRAHHARIAPLEQRGDMKEAEEARRAVLSTFDALVEAGEQVPARERSVAAGLAFEDVEGHAIMIGDAELSGDEREDAELSKEVLPRMIADLEQACDQHVSRYKDPATAASCTQLQAWARYRLSDIMRERGVIPAITDALDAQAHDRCARSIEQARAHGYWYPAHDECRKLLQEHHPERYPAAEDERRLGE